MRGKINAFDLFSVLQTDRIRNHKRMINADLENWIQWQNKKLEICFGGTQTDKEKLYARVIKLNEEVGELCEEILAYNKDQREEKLENKSIDDLAYEIADVLITTLLIADRLGIDPNDALKKKIAKIDKRFENIQVN